MPSPVDAHILADSLQLPDRTPYHIKIGEHVGRRDVDAGSPHSPFYDFTFPNGHVVGVMIHTEAGNADVFFITSTREAITGRNFDVVKLMLDEAATAAEPPKFEVGHIPDLSEVGMSVSADAQPGEIIRAFAASAHAITQAIEAQALLYTRMIIARIPPELREWAENQLPLHGLEERVIEYGVQGQIGGNAIFSANSHPLEEGFEDEAAFLSSMESLKAAWAGILDLEVRPDNPDRFAIVARPLRARESAEA